MPCTTTIPLLKQLQSQHSLEAACLMQSPCWRCCHHLASEDVTGRGISTTQHHSTVASEILRRLFLRHEAAEVAGCPRNGSTSAACAWAVVRWLR